MKKLRLFYIPICFVLLLIILDGWSDGTKNRKADQARQKQIEVKK
jgi:hypothetical protein